jgi:DNA-binding transcriptional ArsR family regulator
MDSLVAAAARALVAGDALGALKRVALREDPPALALRGIAMAQLGEHPRARELLRRAARGFGAHEELARALRPLGERAVVVLVPPIDGDPASLLALLADGAAWSTSALALALGASQRTVQRALVELEAAGRVRSIGRARAQRWLSPPLAGFTTNLLLPAALLFT